MKSIIGIESNDGGYPFRLTLDPEHFPDGMRQWGALLTREEAESLRDDLTAALDPPRRFVEVRLLDVTGMTARGERKPTWSYEDTLEASLVEGDFVMVPFGWNNKEQIAKVVSRGDKPEYTGPGIKQVSSRLVQA